MTDYTNTRVFVDGILVDECRCKHGAGSSKIFSLDMSGMNKWYLVTSLHY
jgi:hypothetical protein